MSDLITPTGAAHLRWALVDGIGPTLFTRLLAHFETAEAAWGAPADQLAKIHRLGSDTATKIARRRDEIDLEPELAAAAEHNVRIICRADPDYPPALRQLPDAPIVLFVRGDLRPDDAVAIAIVGTRKCSIYASEQARRFAELLAGSGFTVVSGLARGIDAFAHHGAIDAGGRTLAVMGTGLSEIYPPENRALADKLLEHGAWISELPMQREVQRQNFPSRNRIIAGLTLGTLVVEAPRRSGALITAKLAQEYNREVFAIPGRAGDPLAFGPNDLIRRGHARLVMELADILEELRDVSQALGCNVALESVAKQPARGNHPRRSATSAAPAPADRADLFAANPPRPAQLTETEQAVLSHVPSEPAFQDVVLQACNLPPGEVLAALTTLELKALIKRLPGNMVARV